MSGPKGNPTAAHDGPRGSQKFDSIEDAEVAQILNFDEAGALDRLLNLPRAARIVISPDLQAEMGIEIGQSLTAQYPWVYARKEVLEEHLPGKTPVERQLKEKVKDMEPGRRLMMAYVPDRTSEEDSFLIITDRQEEREVNEIVKKLELVQERSAARIVLKTPKRWLSQGSEPSVECYIPVRRANIVNLEVQSIFPIQRSNFVFQHRMVDDVRDGYLELVPGKQPFSNIVRKSIDVGIQTAPPKIDRFQQTDPTFPTNAWFQYLYEINAEDKDAESTKAAVDNSSADASSELAASSHVEELLSTLEFSQIDMYKNDYPCMAQKAFKKYSVPVVDEVMCFMDRSKCSNRCVTAIDWHPELLGILVAAYAFETSATLKNLAASGQKTGQLKTDAVNRITFEKCPVLIWGFDDSLVPKLELQSTREVTALSFCPYDGNLLIGGMSSGQVIIWDLSGQIERVEEEHGNPKRESQYRTEIRKLMGWSKYKDIDRTVEAAAVSALERSPRKNITAIKWLPRNVCCSATGQVKEQPDKLFRFFMTASLDGSVCFWDLDFGMPSLRKLALQMNKTALLGQPPTFEQMDNFFYPTYKVKCDAPIASIAMDEARYRYVPLEQLRDDAPDVRVRFTPEVLPAPYAMSLTVGSMLGEVFVATWEGYDYNPGEIVNDEAVREKQMYKSLHDGPILAIERNAFFNDVLLTIGGKVFALWNTENRISPIFWGKKSERVTACRWSLDRVSVFFIGLENGFLEIWDVSFRFDMPCLKINLGERILTTISQQRISGNKRYLAVADYNSNIRVFTIPHALYHTSPEEVSKFRLLIDGELTRKADQSAWMQTFYELHKEKIEAQLKAKREAKELAERLEIEKKEHDDFLRRQAIEEAKKKAATDAAKRTDLTKRLEAKWRATSFKYLLDKIRARRNIVPEVLAKKMSPEKARRKYNAEKKAAITANLARAEGEFFEFTEELVPADKPLENRADELRERMGKFKEDILDYQKLEDEANEVLKSVFLPKMTNFANIVVQAQERRRLVDEEQSANIEHLESYERKRLQRKAGAGSERGDTESTASNTSPDGLQRARLVTFIDDVPDELEALHKNTPIVDDQGSGLDSSEQ